MPEPQHLNPYWSGVLTESNIEAVAARIRELFEGRVFSIASSYCVDSGNALLGLKANCRFTSRWTDGKKEMVRVWPAEGNCPAHIAFSAGGWYWSLHCAPSNAHDHDHDDYRTPYIHFDGDTMYVTSRAPAGKGFLHKHAFSPHNHA